MNAQRAAQIAYDNESEPAAVELDDAEIVNRIAAAGKDDWLLECAIHAARTGDIHWLQRQYALNVGPLLEKVS